MPSYHSTRFYSFKKDSPLNAYIARKGIYLEKNFIFYELMYALKKIIHDEDMFDSKNTSIVICDIEMEKALQIKSFHYRQLVDVVETQVKQEPKLTVKYSFKKLQDRQLKRNTSISVNFRYKTYLKDYDFKREYWPKFLKHNYIVDYLPVGTKELFLLKTPLYNVFATLPNFDMNILSPITYEKVLELFAFYVHCNEQSLIDPTNDQIIHIKNDLLGIAFDAGAIHYTQIDSCLYNQLLPSISDITDTSEKCPISH